jgi:predicted nucleic acid-binding protein
VSDAEGGGAAPAPWVLDSSVITALARGDARVMTLAQALDADGTPMVIPVLAVAGALLDAPGSEARAILRGLERLRGAMPAPLRGAAQAARLAEVIRRTGLSSYDAHVAAVADASVCPILTLDAAKWREHARDLDEPLHFIEIADPDEA